LPNQTKRVLFWPMLMQQMATSRCLPDQYTTLTVVYAAIQLSGLFQPKRRDAGPEKIRELARRGEAWGDSESRQMLEHSIEKAEVAST
jgi:hypothetical protein